MPFFSHPNFRNIFLFIFAIALPVVAFMNFGGGAGSPDFFSASVQDQNIAQDSFFIDEERDELLDDTSHTSEKEAPAEESEQLVESPGSNDDTADSDSTHTGIPTFAVFSPLSFPGVSTFSQPYFSSTKNPGLFPVRNWDEPLFEAASVVALVFEPDSEKVLYHKDIFEPRPIASISKLMTALVAVDRLQLGAEVPISTHALTGYGNAGDLIVGEKLRVEHLLAMLLIASSNDAALALEEFYNGNRLTEDRTFVALMNDRAHGMGLDDTFFVEPTGMSPENRSTALDIARLANKAFQVPLLRQFMSTTVLEVSSVDDSITHHLVNSNKLLGVIPEVLGGKTGRTDEAGESLVLFAKHEGSKTNNDYLIYIILGADDRVQAARELLTWVKDAYIWE